MRVEPTYSDGNQRHLTLNAKVFDPMLFGLELTAIVNPMKCCRKAYAVES